MGVQLLRGDCLVASNAELDRVVAGARSGRLVAVERVPNRGWRCRCDCGNETTRTTHAIRTRSARSCGCLQQDLTRMVRSDFRDGQGRITHAGLLSLLDYDADTGHFYWRVQAARRVHLGDRAGRPVGGHGYRSINIGGIRYPEHHLAWFYVHGAWPADFIDHRNLQRDDNRIANLREATASQNRQNTRVQKNNTSGFKGVTRNGSRWAAEIMVDGARIRLGRFDTPEQASAAYIAAKKRLHTHYVDNQGVRA